MPAPRVEIRAPSPGDRSEFLAAMRASEAMHRPWNYPPTTDDAFDRMLARAEHERYASLLARRCEDGAIVGYFNVSEIIRGGFSSAFLGYGAVAAHAGRGYMTEGLALVLDHTFGPLALHRLEANIQPGNVRSIALVRRCGFVHEGFAAGYLKIGGRWRDHEHYAIRAEQWQTRWTDRPWAQAVTSASRLPATPWSSSRQEAANFSTPSRSSVWTTSS